MPVSDGKYYVRTRILPPSYLTDVSQTDPAEDSDVEENYPYVIRHGRDFKLIDPKVYKQLRKHNIRQKTPVRVAECAHKLAQETRKRPDVGRRNTKSEAVTSSGPIDEYCELSPLAKQPLPVKLYSQSALIKDKKTQLDKLSSYEKRLHYECFKPKDCIVQCNSKSPQTNATTKVLNTDFTTKNKNWEEETTNNEPASCFGGRSEEVIDCATCMCCAKGVFYHCTKDGENEGRIAEIPCSCAGPFSECAPRWGCLAVLALIFPCMLCYPPAMACRRLTRAKSNSKRSKKIERK